MPGGLIQILSYGSQDLFLTGTPEITFFKTVYRRHTVFSIESIQVNFDDPVGFGKTCAMTVPKVGDLMHKTYLQITLPQISLQRFNPSSNLEPLLRIAEENFQKTLNFMKINGFI